MDDKIECPYCHEDFEVNTDDGAHYNDGESEQDECPNCEKQVMIYSSCSWYREAEKADCLNGLSKHEWSRWYDHHFNDDYTKKYVTRNCQVCDEREQSWHDVTEADADRVKMYKDIDAKHAERMKS